MEERVGEWLSELILQVVVENPEPEPEEVDRGYESPLPPPSAHPPLSWLVWPFARSRWLVSWRQVRERGGDAALPSTLRGCGE